MSAKRKREALENSNSLLAAMLHEKRPDEEIEAQIVQNRDALSPPSRPGSLLVPDNKRAEDIAVGFCGDSDCEAFHFVLYDEGGEMLGSMALSRETMARLVATRRGQN